MVSTSWMMKKLVSLTEHEINDRLLFVGGGILDAPCDGTACKRGVKDAAPYAKCTSL